MRTPRITPALLLLSCACASTPPAPPVTAPTTRYQIGDYVVYRTSGTALPKPVIMREEIRAVEGNRLRIDVTLTRGKEQRRWVQIITDTPENEQNNILDALYEWHGGKWLQLRNEGNKDILRLAAWTLINPDGRMTDVTTLSCDRTFGGRHFSCTCAQGLNKLNGRVLKFEDSICPDFLWTKGPGGFLDAASGTPVHFMEVTEFGFDKAITPAPLRP